MGLGYELAESSKARVPGLFDAQAGWSLSQVKAENSKEYSKKSAGEERAETANTKTRMGDWTDGPRTDCLIDLLW
jgi:hypothetical protein